MIGQKFLGNAIVEPVTGNVVPCGGVEHAFALGPAVTLGALRQSRLRGQNRKAKKERYRQLVALSIHSDPEI